MKRQFIGRKILKIVVTYMDGSTEQYDDRKVLDYSDSELIINTNWEEYGISHQQTSVVPLLNVKEIMFKES